MNRLSFGQLVLEITCANCAVILRKLQNEQIYVKNVKYINELKVQITVSRHAYQNVYSLIENYGGIVAIKHSFGIFKNQKAFGKYIAVIAVAFVSFVLTLWVPTRVFFVSVEGNITVPDNEILEAAEACGLKFGTIRKSVRSEVIKNGLLHALPQLQWVGVNTAGCTATISVREKTSLQEEEERDAYVCSIVASRDGIIQACTVYRGNQLCQVGQAVTKGQILVSAYTDCGMTTKATRAEAEIMALTLREIDVVALEPIAMRGQVRVVNKRYSLRIGKKLIKLSKDSGNIDTSCGKIYTEKYVCLPGGFVFPFSLICETIFHYDSVMPTGNIAETVGLLESYSAAYLKSSMIAGEVISTDTQLVTAEGFSKLNGRYACIEMIGQVRHEQMLLEG